ncbi:LuxR family transcriptional regulator [Mesorhizobium sp. LMG 17147]|uniref:helix-turn-helix transcriptional regulator n=1 Tax=unclassified Mesorhizobium TaxID=325217 RepID=UPI001FE1139A|nr:LuxR family transcriptional regulator [Mesorhizobium sp. M6A.T.Cr.TU.017.01.1.1]MCP9232802.1 LuxR family transcriptional regulator [Mesorhizobium sp. LMG 17147]
MRARFGGCSFRWDPALDVEPSVAEQRVFDEAAQFGICCGLTIPIIDLRGNFAAMTFAGDKRDAAFIRAAERYEDDLPYVATRFHMFVRRKLSADRIVDGVRLTAREYECAQWAACGKTAWEIGCILGITRRTAAFHLDNAEANWLRVSPIRNPRLTDILTLCNWTGCASVELRLHCRGKFPQRGGLDDPTDCTRQLRGLCRRPAFHASPALPGVQSEARLAGERKWRL